MGIKTIAFILCCLSWGLEARPISYSGGSTLMAFSDSMKNSIYFHYSPTYKYSLGIEALKDKHLDKNYAYLRFTYLLNRKNRQQSQRNLYFQSGLSSEGLDNYFYGIHGDWETRRWFTGFGYKEVKTDLVDYSDQFIQLGVAPYLGEYGDLHTWIMLKSKKNSLQGDWSTYPVLKFFKGDFLIEFGYSKKTQWDVHAMYRF
jgi:hypothetical protein